MRMAIKIFDEMAYIHPPVDISFRGLPELLEKRRQLLELLPRVLNVENFFMQHYQDFLIENLQNSDLQRAKTSIIRLGEIHYPNNRSLEALQKLSNSEGLYAESLQKSLIALSDRGPL